MTVHTGSTQVDDLVEAFVREHPRFPRATVRRLVERTAAELAGDGAVPWSEVRASVAHRLGYVDEIDDGPTLRPAR